MWLGSCLFVYVLVLFQSILIVIPPPGQLVGQAVSVWNHQGGVGRGKKEQVPDHDGEDGDADDHHDCGHDEDDKDEHKCEVTPRYIQTQPLKCVRRDDGGVID